jgi:hypothetical protein
VASQFYMPFRPAFDSNAKFIPGAQVWFTLTGTNTPSPIYSDVGLTTPLTNPVVASAVGSLPTIYINDTINYRVRIYDENAMVGVDTPLEEYDPYIPIEGTLALNAVDIDDLTNATGGDDLGADMVGFLQGAGATARTARDKLRDIKSVKDYGAVGDGVADDRAAFNTAASGFIVPPGTYLIGSSVSIGDVEFLPGASLSIANGATVTFTGSVIAPEAKIFALTGTGAVAGLRLSKAIWFAGDKLNTTNDALTQLQASADAAVTSGEVEFPAGFFTITGATPISYTKGQQVFGAGPFNSEIRYTGLAAYAFVFSTVIGASLRDISINRTNTAPPTSGTAIAVTSGYFSFRNVIVRAASTGISFTGVSAVIGVNFKMLDCMVVGVSATSSNDIFIDNFLISAPNDWLTLSGVTGTFLAGEVITGGTSGAQANVGTVVSGTSITAKVLTKNFTIGETITGATSGATATVGAQTVPHSLGGIRLVNQVEAFVATNGDVIGGSYSMTTDATSYTLGNRPAYNKFSGVYFDSSDNGVSIIKAVEFDFDNCWFSNRPGSGASLSTCDGIRFNGGGAVNNHKHGVLVNATAVRTTFNGFSSRGNSVETANTYDGIAVAANTTDFIVKGCTLGGALSFGTQRYGVAVFAGTSDRYIVADNLASGNGTGTVLDGGSGANKRVANNY